MDENTTKDAAYALFIGEAMSGKSYVKQKGARRNRRIMEFFSKPVAQVNSFKFRKALEESLTNEAWSLIK